MILSWENISNNIDINPLSITFLSTGSASNIDISIHKKNDFIIGKNNHQFPPFLSRLYHQPQYDNININIILIDDRLSKPPYIINNFIDNTTFNTITDNIWISNDNRIKVFAIYDLFVLENDTKYVKQLCDIIHQKNGLFLFHDFSGYSFNKKMGIIYQKLFNSNKIRFSITNHTHLEDYFSKTELQDTFLDIYPKFTDPIYDISIQLENNQLLIKCNNNHLFFPIY